MEELGRKVQKIHNESLCSIFDGLTILKGSKRLKVRSQRSCGWLISPRNMQKAKGKKSETEANGGYKEQGVKNEAHY